MEIIKVATYGESGATNVETASSDVLYFQGANVDAASGKIEIAIDGNDENFLISSDLQSLTNFNAQKKIEATVNGIPINSDFGNKDNTDFIAANIKGLDHADPGKANTYISTILDFMPYVGTGKAVGELIFGVDPVTGEEISRIVAAFGIVGSFVPIPGAAKVGKFVGQAIASASKGKKAIWSTNKLLDSIKNAYSHYLQHGAEFPELKNAKEYVEAAHKFVTNPPAGTLTKVRPNGEKLFYNSESNIFVATTKTGEPKTMFKPRDKFEYWEKQ